MTLTFGNEASMKRTEEISIENAFLGSHDTLRQGFYSAAQSLAPKHPLQQTLANTERNEEEREMYIARTTLGSHIPLRLNLERNIANANGLLGGLKSKRLTAQIIAGNDEDIDLVDVFSVNPTVRGPRLPHEFTDL